MTKPDTFLVLVALFPILFEIWTRVSKRKKEERKIWPTTWKLLNNVGVVMCVLVIVWYVIGTILGWPQY